MCSRSAVSPSSLPFIRIAIAPSPHWQGPNAFVLRRRGHAHYRFARHVVELECEVAGRRRHTRDNRRKYEDRVRYFHMTSQCMLEITLDHFRDCAEHSLVIQKTAHRDLGPISYRSCQNSNNPKENHAKILGSVFS